ncbi:MAG: 50S ribosomal protein L3 [Coriobacteriales bacterium]|nr:50S ribosomal protein L3 [Coriobacteriales bacterium]
MINTILGRKIGMTQVWNDQDEVVPVTVIQAGPCAISQVKTKETDGYCAVQLGFGDIKEKNVTKPLKGHFAKAGVTPVRWLREVRVAEGEEHSVGEVVTVENFADVKKVDVTGRSKGKGFQGTVKRHNFNQGPTTHGSHFHRTHGSVGQCSTPSRVHKGVKMPGHMGDERVTVRNLEVVRVDAEQNILLVKGAVPGAKNGLVIVRVA